MLSPSTRGAILADLRHRRPEQRPEPKPDDAPAAGGAALTAEARPVAQPAAQPSKRPASKRFKQAAASAPPTESEAGSTSGAGAYLAMVQKLRKADENGDGTDGKWLVR